MRAMKIVEDHRRKFGLSDKGAMEIMNLFFTPDEDLYDKRIDEFFDDEVLESNFWLYWRTMFAFENWDSALEMKLYIKRFIHHIGGLPDFTALRFTKYNQYDVILKIKYLESYDSISLQDKGRKCWFDIKDYKSCKKLYNKRWKRACDLTEDD